MPLLRSWVDSANAPDHPFPLNNLPCGVFSTPDEESRCGVAIGDFVLDVTALEEAGLLELPGAPLLDVPFWNEVMEAGPEVWAALRSRLTALLAEGSAERAAIAPLLLPRAGVEMHLPFFVSEYTDFYAGRHHATNVGTHVPGRRERPAAELAAHPDRLQRAGVLGRGLRHPGPPPLGAGQGAGPCAPTFQPSRRFDIELELGAVVGVPSDGPVTVAEADAMIFGYVLLNDWSARDIQAWNTSRLALSSPRRRSPTAHREAETAKAHRG